MEPSASLKWVALFYLWSTVSLLAQEWTWAGFEILGNHSISRKEIIELIPLKVGESYQEDITSWKSWCTKLRKTFSFAAAECSAVRYSDFKAFFVIDVVDKGQQYRNKFREAPDKDISLADARVMDAYKKLQKRLWELFSEGKPPAESADKGYLDYSDPEMHRLVLDLVSTVPPYRKNIIRVLGRDRNPEKRMSAADLLNWAGKTRQSILLTHHLLDDPHSGVRNQLSRFMTHFVGQLQTERERRDVIDSLVLQLDRPSHGDRNKALYNLVQILQSAPEMKFYVKKKGLPLIQYIANNSVLSNVTGPARDLVEKLLTNWPPSLLMAD